MIKTILLDLDDTIYDFHKSEAQSLKKTMLELGINPDEEKIKLYSKINDEHWKRLEKGEITREQVLVGRFDMFFKELKANASALDAKRIYEAYLSKSSIFIEGAKELLEHLSANYGLYLVSNGTASVQAGRIKAGNIKGYFNDIFVSQEIGYNKPDVRYFQKCFEKIDGLNKEETIIIGDSMTSDIKGGINASIHTCLFNPMKKEYNMGFCAEYEVDSLYKIPKLLRDI